jgi:hypothetical protein
MAKAIHVTSPAECARRYGALAKTKMIPGIVVDLVKEVNRGGNGRTTSCIVADYYFGSGIIKRRKLTTRSVVSSEGTSAHAEMRRFLRMQSEPDNESQNPLSQEHENSVPLPADLVFSALFLMLMLSMRSRRRIVQLLGNHEMIFLHQ